ncbi:hypothetical protein EVAR_13194_1 [Eumeta japonica]|uniref:Uncharacterized protein n=1 Tax=Eumeta variegata TaxID=151549 RepID=A0A4C1TS85_EUMVA|nr:hypothetical protein EVAR_13194_1 [Eumeta japonica]
MTSSRPLALRQIMRRDYVVRGALPNAAGRHAGVPTARLSILLIMIITLATIMMLTTCGKEAGRANELIAHQRVVTLDESPVHGLREWNHPPELSLTVLNAIAEAACSRLHVNWPLSVVHRVEIRMHYRAFESFASAYITYPLVWMVVQHLEHNAAHIVNLTFLINGQSKPDAVHRDRLVDAGKPSACSTCCR